MVLAKSYGFSAKWLFEPSVFGIDAAMSLRPPENFETERAYLRPVAGSDARAIFQGYANDSIATRFMNFGRHETVWETDLYAKACEQGWRQGTVFAWAVLAKESRELLGVVDLRLEPPKAGFGYILGRSSWGQGLAPEVMRPILEWTKSRPEITRIWATCHAENTRSARVLEKLGLRLEWQFENTRARPNTGAKGLCLMFAIPTP